MGFLILDFRVVFSYFESLIVIRGMRSFSLKMNWIISRNDHKGNCIFHCHVDSVCHQSSSVRFHLSHNHLIDVFYFVSFSFYDILVYC